MSFNYDQYALENCLRERNLKNDLVGDSEHAGLARDNIIKYFNPFCGPINWNDRPTTMQEANGTFNKPHKVWKVFYFKKNSQRPECLYECHQMAAKTPTEYDLFRYCAKGFFYQNVDRDKVRDDFVLNNLKKGKTFVHSGKGS